MRPAPRRSPLPPTRNSAAHPRAAVRKAPERKKPPPMLYTVFVVLLVLWLLGMGTSFTAGGLIHILLVLAVISLIVQLVRGRRIA